MRRGSIIAVLLAAGVVVAGCGGASSANTTASRSASTTAPNAVGRLSSVTWDLPYGEPSSLDPSFSVSYSESSTVANMCETLIRFDRDGVPGPWLAISVTHPTPTTSVYTIRQGVKFWDGTPMTADDVVYSLDRNLDPKVGSLWGAPWFDNVASIKKTGAYQVTVTFKQPDAVFDEMMATDAGAIGEASYIKAKGKRYGTASGGLMCTGPYKLGKWTPGQTIVLKRNDQYWNAAHAAKTETVTIDFVTDPNALTNALLTGQIDGSYEVPVSSVGRLMHTSAGRLYLGPSTEFSLLTVTAKKGPGQDASVRKALSLAIDRLQIAKSIYQSTATPVWSLDFPATWGYGASILRPTYEALPGATPDMARARSLIKAAGAAASAPMTLAVSSADPTTQQIAVYLQALGGQFGLHINLAQLPATKFQEIAFDPKAAAAYDMFLQNGYYDIHDPLEQLIFSALPSSLFNYLGYTNPTVTRLVERARGLEDLDARAQALNAAVKILFGQDTAQILIASQAERVFMNKRVTGAPTGMPTYLYYPWAADLGAPK